MQQQDSNAMTAMPTVPTDDPPLQTAGGGGPIQGRIGFVGLGRMGSASEIWTPPRRASSSSSWRGNPTS
jgi:hypothetical protein